MYSQSVPALISKNVGNSLTNYKTWGGILYNAKDYGAEIDGLTDDTAAVQLAIDTAYDAGGGMVFFVPGTCLITGITLKSNVNLVGVESSSTLKLKAASSADLISGTTSSSMSISGLILDGNKVQQTYVTGLCCVKLTNCDDVQISKNVIKNAWYAHGIQLVGGSNNIIEDCRIKDNLGNGIVFTASTNLRIVNNHIQTNGVRGIGDYGVNFSSVYILIEGNIINNNTTDGISLEMDYDTLDPKTTYVTISNNIIKENGVYGILCQAQNAVISGNQVISNGSIISDQGIIIQAKYFIVEGNTVRLNGGVGIDLGNCQYGVVSNNHVLDNGCLGIECASSDQMTITGNIVARNNRINYGVASAGGIMVYGSTDYPQWTGVSSSVVVSGNRIVLGTYQNYGIYIDAVAINILIADNLMLDSGNIGDLFNLSSSVMDRNNLSRNNSPNSVLATAATNVVIAALSDVLSVQGTTTINTIKFPNDVYPIGKEITIFFTSILIVNDKSTLGTGNIHLTGSTLLTTTVGTVLRLVCNGTRWTEISRSIK